MRCIAQKRYLLASKPEFTSFDATTPLGTGGHLRSPPLASGQRHPQIIASPRKYLPGKHLIAGSGSSTMSLIACSTDSSRLREVFLLGFLSHHFLNFLPGVVVDQLYWEDALVQSHSSTHSS